MESHLSVVVSSGFVLVLVADLIGNSIRFTNRLINAVVSAIIWGVLFIILNYSYDAYDPPPLVSYEYILIWTAVGIMLVFVSDLIGNMIAFENRFRNSFVTATVWAVAFYIVASAYLSYAFG